MNLYIHIPFCKTRCAYCDFYSSTDFTLKKRLIDAICTELSAEKKYIKNEPVKTIYFGGGTPSLLTEDDFRQLFSTIEKEYDISACEEITLEANPDDLTTDYILMLRRLPFNRISIGVQSLVEDELRLINRRHSAAQAQTAVQACFEAGLTNINVDIIYGYSSQTINNFLFSVDNILNMNIKHISAYHLTYEKGTVLWQKLQRGEITPIDEELSLKMYQTLVEKLEEKGFRQYEISNFAQPGFESKHNSSYWNGSNYLGVGPSAHSFNGTTRKWNKSSISDYLQDIEAGTPAYELETLSETDQYNDFIITSLRTVKGISLAVLEEKFGKYRLSYCLDNARNYLQNNILVIENNYLRFTQKGFTVSDGVMADLLFVEEE